MAARRREHGADVELPRSGRLVGEPVYSTRWRFVMIVPGYSEPRFPGNQKKVTFLVGGKRKHHGEAKQTPSRCWAEN